MEDWEHFSVTFIKREGVPGGGHCQSGILFGANAILLDKTVKLPPLACHVLLRNNPAKSHNWPEEALPSTHAMPSNGILSSSMESRNG